MDARVFISRRSSDGADKAAALAHDLEALFGDGQIDVEGMGPPPTRPPEADGSTAPRLTPMLLVLITPDYFGALDGEGQRCMDRADDVARLELEAAILAGWRLLPLLGDGVVAMPPLSELPPPFDRLPSLPWRRLSTDDWRADIAQIADDLRHLGLVARHEPTDGTLPLSLPVEGPITTPMVFADDANAGAAGGAGSAGRRRALGLLGIGALVVVGSLAWRWQQRRTVDLNGGWKATIGPRGAPASDDGGAAMVVAVEHKGRTVRMNGTLFVSDDAQWQDLRADGKQRTGEDLQQVIFKGEGELTEDASEAAASVPAPTGAQRRLALAVTLVAPDAAGTVLDTGTLSAAFYVETRRIHGRLRFQSERADRTIDLRRAD